MSSIPLENGKPIDDDSCVLCSIVVDESHPHRVTDDDTTVTILNHRPAVPGHLLVMSRQHVEDAWSCPSELYEAVYAAVHTAAALLRDRLAPDGLTIVEALRPAGWQSVPHLHTHVLPRRDGDGLPPIWTSREVTGDDQLAQIREQLQASN